MNKIGQSGSFIFTFIKIPDKNQQALLFALTFYRRFAFQIDQNYLCVFKTLFSPKHHQYRPRYSGCHRNQPSSQPAVLSRCSSSSLTSLHPHRASTSVTLKIRTIWAMRVFRTHTHTHTQKHTYADTQKHTHADTHACSNCVASWSVGWQEVIRLLLLT